jgi:hypothetical protein
LKQIKTIFKHNTNTNHKTKTKIQQHENIESWVIDWAPLRPKKHPLCGVAEGLLRKVGKEMVERFALKGRAVQVQLTRSELRGKVKPGAKKVQYLPGIHYFD